MYKSLEIENHPRKPVSIEDGSVVEISMAVRNENEPHGAESMEQQCCLFLLQPGVCSIKPALRSEELKHP